MGLAQYVYPRFAVPITANGQIMPIDKLRAHPLWYPGSMRPMVSGHVLYTSRALENAMLVALDTGDADAEVAVVDGERGISHRLAAPVPTSRYASVPELIRAIVERTRQALPETKQRLRRELQELARAATSPEVLVEAEQRLQQEGLHVLVPLAVGGRYQLFTDATEALLPVSPLVLGRQSRLCFVLLSIDSLVEKREGSPWLRQAAEWMVLPVAAMRVHPQVASFVGALPPLRQAMDDSYLLWDLAAAIHDITGGWPDLCDRFYERLGRNHDLSELRDWLRELARLVRAAERDPAQYSDQLLQLGLGGAADLPDLLLPGERTSAAYEVLLSVVERPVPFRWEDHGRAYLDGLISWERGLAVPRSRALELALRARLAGRAARSHSGMFAVPRLEPPPGPRVRWLHISDLHLRAQPDGDVDIVLEALLSTVEDMRRHGRMVDLIFVTGDIAFSGKPAEYERAESFLISLCAAAGVPRSALHMVPGNHDVDRALSEGLARTLPDARAAARYFEEGAMRHHLAKLDAFRRFYNRFYAGETSGSAPRREAAPGQATAGPEVVAVGGLTVGILPLNTAWFAVDDQDSGNLLVGEALVRSGLAALSSATLRVVLMHHPLSYLSDIERRLVQERLLDGCHLLLRGHLHDTEAQLVNTGYKQMLILAAGASYQGRTPYQNRALFVEVDVQPAQQQAQVHPYPIRYEMTGHDRWTLDTSVFPRSYPSYLEVLPLPLGKK
ncbi:MAG: metallophosphoesterase [Myxococcales bacterium]|nr:metallophosphoesterase [Myxococcota bacterium]MDW8283666.1 metallophosphoesterase [Myxococcales bacterium]